MSTQAETERDVNKMLYITTTRPVLTFTLLCADDDVRERWIQEGTRR